MGSSRRNSGRLRAETDDFRRRYGKSSPYCSARCPWSGVTALHACAINGFLGLLKAFVEYGHCDPLDVAEPLGCLFDAKVGGRVRAGRSHGVAAAP